MRSGSVELRHIALPLKTPFETSFAREVTKDCIIICVRSEGLRGWGESPVTVDPLYSSETIGTAKHILKDFLVPLLTVSLDPQAFATNASRYKGHPMAKAGLEAALWDLRCESESKSLSQLLGGVKSEVEVGVSVGLEPTVDDILAKAEEHLGRGYQRVKLKIKPGMDAKLLEAFKQRFPEIPLQADANCGYLSQHISELADLDKYQMLTFEQPFAAEDLASHRELQKLMKTSICLDESVGSVTQAEQALKLEACRNINVKPARVGGFSAALKIHEMGVQLWVGGMLETGIGRLHNLGLASLPAFTLPGDISASDRYFTQDILVEPVVLKADSRIEVPSWAGGVDRMVRPEALERFTVSKEMVEFG